MTDRSGAYLAFCILDSLCRLKEGASRKKILGACLRGIDAADCDFGSYDMLEADPSVERTLLHLGLARQTEEGDVSVKYLDYKPKATKSKAK